MEGRKSLLKLQTRLFGFDRSSEQSKQPHVDDEEKTGTCKESRPWYGETEDGGGHAGRHERSLLFLSFLFLS